MSKKSCQRILFSLVFLVFCFLVFSCKDETSSTVFPTIKLEVDSSFISSDTILNLDQKVRVKVTASSEGSAITLFNFKIYDGDLLTSVDSGMNCTSFSTVISLSKGFASQERWVFRVRNKDMQWDSVSLSVALRPNSKFGNIIYLSGIKLGAQNNSSFGSFYSLTQNKSYLLDSAFNHQDLIDLCYYYDGAGDLNTLASPGASISPSIYLGTSSLSAWSIKNETRYVQTSLATSDFDRCLDDSLIIANSFVYQSGKRKCKLLVSGNIYAFTRGERKGLIKFVEVNGTDGGTMTMDIKIQKN